MNAIVNQNQNEIEKSAKEIYGGSDGLLEITRRKNILSKSV